MTYYLLITAFTVSIDSFVCGFSLALGNGKKAPIILMIALTVLAMCLATNYLTYLFSDILSENVAAIGGGLILIGVGFYNFYKSDEVPFGIREISNVGIVKQSLISGFAVGLDGALANLSLALMGINKFYVPITIAVMHALTISLGVLLSSTALAKKMQSVDFLPPLILVLLGLYKIFSVFL